jgi:DNA-binding IclR family transcriptional regulator
VALAAQPETSRTVDRALVLLRAVGEHGPAGSAELARHTGLNRTVVHRLLATLAARGFVQRDAEGYALGTALVELGSRARADVRQRARPVLERLSAQFGETCVLTVADDVDAVAVDQVLGSEHLVRVEYAPGFRHPLAVGAHGRAVLAFADRALVDRVMAACAEPSALESALAATRERGWAVSHDELQFGASGVAAPLLDEQGAAMASVGIVAPVTRFPDVDEVATATLAAIADLVPGEIRAGRP